MKSGVCPKCQSEEVYFHAQTQSKGSYLTLGWFGQLRLERYLCLSCGLSEEYLAEKNLQDPQKLAKIREILPKVKP